VSASATPSNSSETPPGTPNTTKAKDDIPLMSSKMGRTAPNQSTKRKKRLEKEDKERIKKEEEEAAAKAAEEKKKERTGTLGDVSKT
jgi:hypothetical protein